MRELRELDVDNESEDAGSSQTTSESSENTRQYLPKADGFMETDTKTNFLCFQSDLEILLKAKEAEYAEAQAEIKGEST